jgi:hypothetical protein
MMKTLSSKSTMLVMCVCVLVAAMVRIEAAPRGSTAVTQAEANRVAVNADDIGGVVTSSKGPEAGVWVIAETADLPTENEEGGTYVIPGRGHIGDRHDVVNYRDMVTIIRGRIQNLINKGMTLEQVKAAKTTLDYDRLYGAKTGPWTTDMFVEAIYRDLSKSKTTQKVAGGR